MDTQALIDKIKAIDSPEAMEVVADLFEQMEGAVPAEVKAAFWQQLKVLNTQSKKDREEIANTLRLHGVDYPLDKWLTPKNYALKFGISNIETVLGWINRGVISKENIREIPELNLRLVRAIEYTPRKYNQNKQEKTS
ncbi:hypothetical protein IC229_27435 [Spirosoma sp. BT702]|uniref:Uncharacterized protein n=1 Tax=Spirosoma profusum TaxID=2771354 RepID=A0A926Y0J0_9BACT|nr:hypothetical protein [Spirosoma profusum]MBD2704404.1 hypothetical protein [Spirosoma profusum]